MDKHLQINDEPAYTDTLGHNELIEHLIQTLLECDPPYVIGVSGSWGSGKTSFLRKTWALMGGEFQIKDDEKRLNCCKELLGNNADGSNRYESLREKWKIKTNTKMPTEHGFSNWQVIWFNPWQHQFENNPLIALLHEIRAQYSITEKAKGVVSKSTNIATDAILEMLVNAAKSLSLGLAPKLDLDKIRQKGERYENQRFETALTSQTFSAYFEQAVNTIVKDKGRLLICIDDLDRCEGEVAYRLLESLKLYLNAKNCIFILGMDQNHLEKNLQPFKNKPRAARDYLDKMLQDRFVLPVPRDMKYYIHTLLDNRKIVDSHPELFTGTTIDELAETLNNNLPHNPRKIKLFLAVWQRYLELISKQKPVDSLDWRITVILCYLTVYEEPIYRSIELAPGKFASELLNFVRGTYPHGDPEDDIYHGLELPPNAPVASGGTSTGPTAAKYSPHYFWIASLINKVFISNPSVNQDETIRHHLIDSRKVN